MHRNLLVTVVLPMLFPIFAEAADCERGARLYQRAWTQGNPAARIDLLRQSTQACPDPVAFAALGEALLAAGDPDGAIDALNNAFGNSDDPSQQAQISARMAYIQHRQGRIGEAIGTIGIAFDLMPPPRPQWFYETRRTIDTDPSRNRLTAAQINRAMTTRSIHAKGFSAMPTIDVYIHFDFDSDIPNADGMTQLRSLGEALATRAADTNERFRLIGHADTRGSHGYNQGLSERRAANVQRQIGDWHPELKVRMRNEGRGKREPIYLGDTDEDHRLNRRVEVRAYYPR